MTTRRLFLKSSGLAMFGVGAAPMWLARAADAPSPRKKVLVAIFQRGAVDGLNVVVPFGEKSYYALRPTIAIPAPKARSESAIDLDGFFGLHPALAPLKPIYDAGQLAIVHAVGSPDPTRSHFDAQDYMESGTPGRKATTDGWLNRALPRSGRREASRRCAQSAWDRRYPARVRGHNEAVAINNLNEFQSAAMPAGPPRLKACTRRRSTQMLNGTGRETFDAVKLMQSIQAQPYTPANGAKYPSGRLGQSLMQIARLIKADVGLEVAFTDVGGWDTHVNEAGQTPAGQLRICWAISARRWRRSTRIWATAWKTSPSSP